VNLRGFGPKDTYQRTNENGEAGRPTSPSLQKFQ